MNLGRALQNNTSKLMGLYKLYGSVDSFVCVDSLHLNQHVSVMSGRVFLVKLGLDKQSFERKIVNMFNPSVVIYVLVEK